MQEQEKLQSNDDFGGGLLRVTLGGLPNYAELDYAHYTTLRMYSDYQNRQAYQLPNATYYTSLRTALLRSSAVHQLVNHKRGRSVSRVANSIPARRQSNGEKKKWEDPPKPRISPTAPSSHPGPSSH